MRSLTNPAYLYRPSQVVRRIRRPQHGHASVRLPWGDRIAVDLDEHLGAVLARRGVHEMATTELLWGLTAPGELALDIGANIGYFTSLLAARGARVIAFEPHPDLCAALQQNAQQWSGEIMVRQEAVSSASGTAGLDLGPDFYWNRGTASLTADGAIPVETIALDDAITEPVGVMKLDIEGHEPAALRGADRLLHSGLIRDVVFEDLDITASETATLLQARGYSLFGIASSWRGVKLVAPLSPQELPWAEAPNYLATREPHRVRELIGPGWRSLRNGVNRGFRPR